MHKFKNKLRVILLVLSLLLSLAACGRANQNEEVDTSAAEALISDAFADPLTEWNRYDELITQIKSETDYARRAKLMHEAEDILMSTGCVIPIYYFNDVYLQKSYVEGIYANSISLKCWAYAKMTNGSDTLRMHAYDEPSFLDPALMSSCLGYALNSFSGLYIIDAGGQSVPACAEDCTVSGDGLTYTVTLKKNLKWSDGKPLTAADFEYAWKRAAAPETGADYGYQFSVFKGYDEGEIAVRAVDDITLVFELSAPCAYMKDLMAFPTFYPVQKDYVEAHSTAESPGAWAQEPGFPTNGAFVLTGWNHNVSMTYEKNPYWYDADRVSVNRVEFMLSSDDAAIFAAYSAGDIDFADSVPIDEIQSLLSDPEFHIVDVLGTYFAAFNCKSALFEGKTPAQAACMRQAFSLLIDRSYICENICQTGQVAASAFIPVGMADGNGGVFRKNREDGYFDAYAMEHDREGTVKKAITLLEAAGFRFRDGKLSKETPIRLEYKTESGSIHTAVAESIQADFSELGIEMNILAQDSSVFYVEKTQGNFEFARANWYADFNDPINMLEMWTTDSGNNICQFGR